MLKVGEWSDWVPLEFEMIPGKKLHAICRFYLKAVEPELEVYVSPINYDPMAPDAPISTPASYATELAEASGRFYTQGMPEDTKSFTEGILEMDQFLEQARYRRPRGDRAVRRRPRRVRESSAGFLFYYFGNADQLSHVMWASMDPGHPAYKAETYGQHADLIPSIYEELDGVVGRTLDAIGDRGLVVVMSDHGFSSWRRSFNLNTLAGRERLPGPARSRRSKRTPASSATSTGRRAAPTAWGSTGSTSTCAGARRTAPSSRATAAR